MTVVLQAADARMEVSPSLGGRWTSLQIDGLEVLGASDDDEIAAAVRQGCFTMAPYAGRVRNGLLRWRGTTHQLPVTGPPHALHGTVLDVPWRVISASSTQVSLEVEFGAHWPWAGKLRQRVSLAPGRLDVELVATAVEAMPITMGLHPWFRRRLARGGDVQLHLPAKSQYEKDVTGLPSGRLMTPRPGPWDDCFVCEEPVVLRWPGVLDLSISSSHDHFVIFDERPAAVCVEPQTGPPNAFELDRAHQLASSESLRLAVSLTWVGDSTGGVP
jgi:galactose mutarotase-like enzyme